MTPEELAEHAENAAEFLHEPDLLPAGLGFVLVVFQKKGGHMAVTGSCSRNKRAAVLAQYLEQWRATLQ